MSESYDYLEYKEKITSRKPVKTTTCPNGELHENVYHWDKDNNYITGCVRTIKGVFEFQIRQVNFKPSP